jgi:chemotaxis protein CheX
VQKLLQQLDDAVAEVFSLMLDRPCAPALVCLRRDSGFTASVAFSGSLEGNCALHLDLSSAGELAEELTGDPAGPDSDLPADTVGELCNMIAGSWKSRLDANRSACMLSSPIVTEGRPAVSAEQTIVRSYQFREHCLTLELRLS